MGTSPLIEQPSKTPRLDCNEGLYVTLNSNRNSKSWLNQRNFIRYFKSCSNPGSRGAGI